MHIETWPVSKPTPYPGNPRINDDAVAAVAASLREYGFRQPIVVDSDGVIVCGHTRLKAAQKLGLDNVPVHIATDLTPDQIRAFRIARQSIRVDRPVEYGSVANRTAGATGGQLRSGPLRLRCR